MPVLLIHPGTGTVIDAAESVAVIVDGDTVTIAPADALVQYCAADPDAADMMNPAPDCFLFDYAEELG